MRRAALFFAVLGAALSMRFDSSVQCGPNPHRLREQPPRKPAERVGHHPLGRPSIQGFTTGISVNRGQIVHFKISTTASDYRVDIYRMGYYGDRGARLITTVQPSVTLPQSQPACLTNATAGLRQLG